MAMSVMMLERPQGPLSVTLTKPRGLLSVHSKPGPQPWEGPVSTPRTNAARRHTQKQRAGCQRAEPRCTCGPGVGGRGSGEWILRQRLQGPHTLLLSAPANRSRFSNYSGDDYMPGTNGIFLELRHHNDQPYFFAVTLHTQCMSSPFFVP